VQLRPLAAALQVLERLCVFGELEQVAKLRIQHVAYLSWSSEEEFSAEIGKVQSPIREVPMEFGFKRHGIFRKEQRMNVETKRN
jgi:hypothetical protein